MSPPKRTTRRDPPYSLRIAASDRKILERAAFASGRTLGGYILFHALRAAERDLKKKG